MSQNISKGIDLLAELERNSTIPPYNAAGLLDLQNDLTHLFQLILNIQFKAKPADLKNPELHHRLLYYTTRSQRIKRIATTYIVERYRRLAYLWWITGLDVPDDIKSNLSSHEVTAVEEYDSLVNTYIRQTKIPIRSMYTPPRMVFIEIEVMEDCGDVMTENGSVRLTKGSRLLLKRTDCEDLLKRGSVREIN